MIQKSVYKRLFNVLKQMTKQIKLNKETRKVISKKYPKLFKKSIELQNIEKFKHDILKYDGDIWIRLRCVTLDDKCGCKPTEYDLEPAVKP